MSVDCYGPYGQIFNDFGESFEVVDKDGEDTVEVLIEDITVEEKGIVKLAKGLRHPYSDGDTIRIQGVKGMSSLENETLSINGTIHTIKVINSNSFEIGNTTGYAPYEG
jgi:ubiquitin-activating enzyme E1-like protein 2